MRWAELWKTVFGWDSPGRDFFLSCTHVGNFTQPELNPQGEALY